MKFLNEKLKQLPKMPGVYLFKDDKGTIIYIGKAKILFNRVHSYFSAKGDLKTNLLTRKITDFDYFVTNNEMEALLLENNLIKKHQPKYNIKLKDSTSYPLIRVTAENLPRIVKCREKRNPKEEYFGPYVSVAQIKFIIQMIKKIFKIRSCSKKFTPPYNYPPCLYYHINLCSAPCASYISEDEYLEKLNSAKELLRGNLKGVKKRLEQEMLAYSEKMEFEKAAKVRDDLQMLAQFEEEQLIYAKSKEDYDFIGFYFKENRVSISLIQQQGGLIMGKQSYLLSGIIYTESRSAIVADFLKSYYLESTKLPSRIYLRELPEDNEILNKAFSQQTGKNIEILQPYSVKHKRLIKLAEENAELYYEERQYKFEKIHHLRELKRVLEMENLPRRIECFDIATLNGKYNTAALVSFKDGKPDKSEYRQLNIEGEGHPDDYAMMEEAVGRRYQKLKNEKLPMPDLIVVDGGKGQVSAAHKILRLLELDIPLIGLAKKHEHIFKPGSSRPLILDKSSYALKLLQAVRDESHRFSNVRLSMRYKNDLLHSELQKIEGVGKKRVNILLKKFKSVQAIKKASLEKLASTEGIGENLAKMIYSYFHRDSKK